MREPRAGREELQPECSSWKPLVELEPIPESEPQASGGSEQERITHEEIMALWRESELPDAEAHIATFARAILASKEKP